MNITHKKISLITTALVIGLSFSSSAHALNENVFLIKKSFLETVKFNPYPNPYSIGKTIYVPHTTVSTQFNSLNDIYNKKTPVKKQGVKDQTWGSVRNPNSPSIIIKHKSANVLHTVFSYNNNWYAVATEYVPKQLSINNKNCIFKYSSYQNLLNNEGAVKTVCDTRLFSYKRVVKSVAYDGKLFYTFSLEPVNNKKGSPLQYVWRKNSSLENIIKGVGGTTITTKPLVKPYITGFGIDESGLFYNLHHKNSYWSYQKYNSFNDLINNKKRNDGFNIKGDFSSYIITSGKD